MGFPASWRLVLATTLGGALEWYDLVLYGLFSVTFSHLFFEVHHGALSLALSLGTFGVAFAARPAGAAWLGSYADRFGRRRALVLSSAMMTIGTALLAVAPSSATIGPAAPLLVVASRLLQGFAAGGEFGSAAAMLAERDPARRGFYSSLQWSASGAAVTLAALLAWSVRHYFAESAVENGAWRLPFLLGVVLGPAATWLRLRGGESAAFVQRARHLPLREIVTQDKRRLLVVIGLVALGGSASYLNVYMPTYARTQLHLSSAGSLLGTVLSGVLTIVLPPVFAGFGDRHSRRRLMLVAAVFGGVLAWPLFLWLVASPSVLRLIAIQSLLVTCIYCGYYASVPALMADIFGPRNRASAIALGYAVGQLLFGGFTPVLLQVLIDRLDAPTLPGLYLGLTAILSISCLLFSRRLTAPDHLAEQAG